MLMRLFCIMQMLKVVVLYNMACRFQALTYTEGISAPLNDLCA